MKKGLLIIMSGPSGVGKGTIRKCFMDDDSLRLAYSISMTTRKPRANEVDGVDYIFTSREHFEEAIRRGELLEWAEFVGNYYGTPLAQVEELRNEGKNVLYGTVDEVFTRPKSAMAKQLIYPDGKRNSLATGKRYCRIVFDGNSSFEPVVSNMVLECKAPVNIMFADTKNIDGKAYGQMILQLPEDERAAKRALAYLETQNVHAEEVADYASV